MRATLLAFASLTLVACGFEVSSDPNMATDAPAHPGAVAGTGGAGGASPTSATGGTGGSCAGAAGSGGSAGTVQILDPVGAPTVASDAVAFVSECHDDEVATGILVSGGEWGNIGISMLCTQKSDDGLLGVARQAKQHFEGPAPVYGGGCPGNLRAPVAYGLVLSFGLETTTQRNVLRNVGVVCGPGHWPSAPEGETVIVRERNFLKMPFAPLESPTDFQLDCTDGRYLTGVIGLQEPSAPTPNTLVRLGAMCDIR